jgi:glycosyltransferase involved in cell wall biosynthesis
MSEPSAQGSIEVPLRPVSALGFSFITPIARRITGLSSYAESLIDAFASRHRLLSVKFFTNVERGVFERLGRNPNVDIVPIGFKTQRLFRAWSIGANLKASLAARLAGVRCLVSITPQGSFVPFVDQLLTVHDTYDLDPDYAPPGVLRYARAVRALSALGAKGIICVSDSTLRDLRKLTRSSGCALGVIKEASKYGTVGFDSGSASAGARRFLFVANVTPTKNVACLLQALGLAQRRGLPIEVDWVGRDSDGLVAGWLREHGNLKNFHPLGTVLDPALRAAYRAAAALVVPSLKEGFCLPVLEAHSFGTPVIAADIPILREVAAEGALFFNPTDPEELLAAMLRLSTDDALRASLRERALANSRLYSWNRAAEELERFAAQCCGVAIGA